MKRIDWYLIPLQIFAVVASYLMISATFVSAFQVSIITDAGETVDGEMKSFDDYISKSFVFTYDYALNTHFLKASFSPFDAGIGMKKVYFYVCRDYNPVQCIQRGDPPHIGYVSSGSIPTHEEELKWSDVNTAGVANFLTLIKMDVAGRTVWTGSWDTVTRTGSGTGSENFQTESYDLGKMNMYLNPSVSSGSFSNYLDNYGRVPMNYANRTVIPLVETSAADRLYQLLAGDEDLDPSGTANPVFSTNIISGREIQTSSKKWSFIFGGNGKISNPVAFYSTGTDSGSGGLTGARLMIDSWDQTLTCDSDQSLNAEVHVENTSMIDCGQAECFYESFYYEVEGVTPSESLMVCTRTGTYQYNCTIPVSNFPVCPAPSTSQVTLHFTYSDGTDVFNTFPVNLQKAAPSLVIDSFSPNPFDCGTDTQVMALLRINNPPSGSPAKEYTLDGNEWKTLSCSAPFGNVYSCSIGESEICSLLNENLNPRFRFTYDSETVESSSVDLFVSFPPPSMSIDSLTPETFTAGETTSSEVLLHINYPETLTYQNADFKFDYLGKGFESVTCSLYHETDNRKYYKCPVDFEITAGLEGPYQVTFALDGFLDGEQETLTSKDHFQVRSPPPGPELTITYVSSVDCSSEGSMTVRARADNIQDSPTKYEYSFDGTGFEEMGCSESGSTYTCMIPEGDVCSLLKRNVNVQLRLTYPSETLTSNFQGTSVFLPTPSMTVFSVAPDPMTKGQVSQASVRLYIFHPSYADSNPVFQYSYQAGSVTKTNERMSCQRTKEGSDMDFYECTASFDIPEDYGYNSLTPTFSIQGTQLISTKEISLLDASVTLPEIKSISPGVVQVLQGNSSDVTLTVETGNVDPSSTVSVMSGDWISGRNCNLIEGNVDLYECQVTISVPRNAPTTDTPVTLKLRVTEGGGTKETSKSFTVDVVALEKSVEIQQVTPDKLYCPENSQTNPSQVTIVARLLNVPGTGVSLMGEKITFKGIAVSGDVQRCSISGSTVTCNIPTDKFIELTDCGSGELAPGEGEINYPLFLKFSVRVGSDQPVTLTGSRTLPVEAPPLTSYITFTDTESLTDSDGNGVMELSRIINCLTSNNIELGEDDGEMVTIENADLLHNTPDDEISWSFVLDAQDFSGKLTKGRGSTPRENATICRLKDYVTEGAHRKEFYKCNLFVQNSLFQRCSGDESDPGYGTLELVASVSGKQAKGKIELQIMKDVSEFEIVPEGTDTLTEINCMVNDYSGYCSLDPSRLNTTIRMVNRGTGDISDLNVYQQDIVLSGGDSYADIGISCPRSLTGTNLKCNVDIGPRIPLTEEVNKKPGQTFDSFTIGVPNITLFYKYANNLVYETDHVTLSGITVVPKKTQSMVDREQAQKEMDQMVNTVDKIIRGVLYMAGYCVTCYASVKIWNAIDPTEEQELVEKTGEKKENLQELQQYADNLEKISNLETKNTEHREKLKEYDVQYKAEEINEEKYDELTQPLEYKISQNDKQISTLQKVNDAYGEKFDENKEITNQIDVLREQAKLGTWGTIGAILGIAALLGATIAAFGGSEKVKNEDEYLDIALDGAKFALWTCVIPKVLGGLMDIFGKEGFIGDLGRGVEKGTDTIAGICGFLGSITPYLFRASQILIEIMSLQMCLNNMKRNTGYYGAYGNTASGIYGAGYAMSQIDQCLRRLDNIGDSIMSMTGSVYQSGTTAIGTTGLLANPELYITVGNRRLTRSDTYSSIRTAMVAKYSNLCAACNKYGYQSGVETFTVYVEGTGDICGTAQIVGFSCGSCRSTYMQTQWQNPSFQSSDTGSYSLNNMPVCEASKGDTIVIDNPIYEIRLQYS